MMSARTREGETTTRSEGGDEARRRAAETNDMTDENRKLVRKEVESKKTKEKGTE